MCPKTWIMDCILNACMFDAYIYAATDGWTDDQILGVEYDNHLLKITWTISFVD